MIRSALIAVIALAPLRAADPFAVYQEALDNHLSAMLEKAAATPPPAAAVADEPKAPPKPATVNTGGTNHLAAALGRLQRFRPALEEILASEGLPKELLAVVLIESAAQPYALSSRQARGLWQLIPRTARQYGLQVDAQRDERVLVETSTRAAARYLRDLYQEFGNWPLALAAYNAGQESVRKALDRSRASTFWQLAGFRLLPEETRNYVPAVLAAMRLLAPAAERQPERTEPGRRVYAQTAAAR